MKKFLSLVLALVMTMSLVTIGAGATEYKDLSDKSEIQYEEAVAVLNKLGIITGYEDGSFKPTGALTRGAAAKIIVSLMIGSEAASNLTVAAAPYKDVATNNTFAAVISYCKTAGYISGYADGTFRPTAALTGYAFTKMLLGALGYDGVQEGFTGSGWTMNVAKLGNTAGLFNDFNTAFSGNAGVTREGACLLALNALKATEVEYSGGTNITTTTGNATTNVSTNKTRSYKTSNNTKINQNISSSKNEDADFTLEFGEEHFTDLKLTANGTAFDDFGRPANEWSYKNVKIGTYALTPDFVYTTEASGDTNADKVKDMGLKDFKIAAGDYKDSDGNNITTKVSIDGNTAITDGLVAGNANSDTNAAVLAGLLGNGTRVEVYQSDNNANLITKIVVVHTQLMQVSSVKSSSVTLKKLSDDARDGTGSGGTTVTFMATNTVNDDDSAYNTLKNLKADDYVLVTAYRDGANYTVASVTVPQTASGKMTSIATKSDNAKVKAVTVAGTAYKMSAWWTSEDNNLSAATKLSTSQDATLYLDTYGYAIFVTNVTDTKSAIIVDEIYSSMVDGKIVKYAKGWDSNGTELSLNLGTSNYLPSGYDETSIQGHTFAYEVSTSNSADYKLTAPVSTDTTGAIVYAPTTATYVANGAYQATVTSSGTAKVLPYAADVKFIFLSTDSGLGSDVTGITINTGVTEVGSASKTYNMTYILNKDCNKIVAVIVPNDNDAANTANLLYVQKITGYTNNTDGKRVALFTAYINGEKVTDCQYTKEALTADAFYTYSKNDTTGVYTLTAYTKTDKSTSVISTDVINASDMLSTGTTPNVSVSDTYFTNVNGRVLSAKNATVIDLFTDDGVDYSSYKEMKDAIKDNANGVTGASVSNFQISYIYNGSDNSGSGTVSYIFITKNNGTQTTYAATPVITPLTAVTVNQYSPLTLTVTATPATGYQWYKDGNAITGATSATYTVASAAAANAGQYYCVVTNTDATKTVQTATATSNTVTVTVTAQYKVTASVAVGTYAADAQATVTANGTSAGNVDATVNVAAKNGKAITFTVYANGTPIANYSSINTNQDVTVHVATADVNVVVVVTASV